MLHSTIQKILRQSALVVLQALKPTQEKLEKEKKSILDFFKSALDLAEKDYLEGLKKTSDLEKKDSDLPSSAKEKKGSNPPKENKKNSITDELRETASTLVRKTLIELFGKVAEKIIHIKKKQKNQEQPDEIICIHHETLKPGDICPKCKKGIIKDTLKPEKVYLEKTQKLLKKTVLQLQRLRCNFCGFYFTAKRPENPGYTSQGCSPELASTFVIMRATGGMPYHRLAQLFSAFGTKCRKQKIYEICKEVSDVVNPVYDALKKLIANSTVIANDATSAKILETSNVPSDPNYKTGSKKKPEERKTAYTTVNIGFNAEMQPVGVIYATSTKHSGEITQELLEKRSPDLKELTILSDMANTSDIPGRKKKQDLYVRAGCNDHSIRKFKDAVSNYPRLNEILTSYQEVYAIDAAIKQENLTATDRLKIHQTLSVPLMEKIKILCIELLSGSPRFLKAEGNSTEGLAIKYFLKHYDALTHFLRMPGIPISNIACEQALKRFIFIRKSSMFFLTRDGAHTTAVLASLLQTANLIGIQLNEYIKDLLLYQSEVKKNPEEWTPLRYQQRIFKEKPPDAPEKNAHSKKLAA